MFTHLLIAAVLQTQPVLDPYYVDAQTPTDADLTALVEARGERSNLAALSDEELTCRLLDGERTEVLNDRSAALDTQLEISRSNAAWAANAERTPLGSAIEALGERIVRRSGEQAARYTETAETLSAAFHVFCQDRR